MKSNAENQNFGVKLTNELMTDIIGAIIPGTLFVVCMGISVVIPIMVILVKYGVWEIAVPLSNGALPWVLLILCLVLSYVFGLIFYRADIKVPDKTDIERQIIDSVILYSDRDEEYLVNELKRMVKALKSAVVDGEKNTIVKLNEACTEFQNDVIFTELLFNHNLTILKLLFPEDYVEDRGHLSQYSIDVFEYYRKLFLNLYNKYNHYQRFPFLTVVYTFLDKRKVDDYRSSQRKAKCLQRDSENCGLAGFEFDRIENESYLKKHLENDTFRRVLLRIYVTILDTQCELGCCSEKRGEFPYMNYYKYLLKRNLTGCISYVDWCSRESRSKNQLNEYKIEVQVFASEAYALLNKNESHIRMSSASWHVSYRVRVISWAMIVLIPFLVLLLHQLHSVSNDLLLLYLSLFPMFISMLSSLIKRRITKFIHYQRLREIYYTLYVYNDCRDIIERRKSVMADRNYYIHQ